MRLCVSIKWPNHFPNLFFKGQVKRKCTVLPCMDTISAEYLWLSRQVALVPGTWTPPTPIPWNGPTLLTLPKHIPVGIGLSKIKQNFHGLWSWSLLRSSICFCSNLQPYPTICTANRHRSLVSFQVTIDFNYSGGWKVGFQQQKCRLCAHKTM